MHKIETIKQIQELAKSVGLDKDWHFKDVMKINTDDNEATKEYFLSLVGKCYARKMCKPVFLLYGHEDSIEYNKVLDVRIVNNTVVVYIQFTKVGRYNGSITYVVRDKTTIPESTKDYYKVWEEIDNDTFNRVYEKHEKLVNKMLNYKD